MKLIIAGSRTMYVSTAFITSLIITMRIKKPTLVLCGECEGIDDSGKKWAQKNGVNVDKHPAQWEVYGPKAGPIRNKKMAKLSDALLLIWDGTSSGSANMKKEMQRLNKPIYELIITKHNVDL